MTQKRTYLLITFIYLSLSSYSQNWGDYFKWTEVDSIHVCPSNIEKGKEINSNLIANTGLERFILILHFMAINLLNGEIHYLLLL